MTGSAGALAGPAGQELEALRRRTGRVAHDVNGVLTVVLGYAELLMASLPEGDLLRGAADEMRRAALRGAELTRELLVLSRPPVPAPRGPASVGGTGAPAASTAEPGDGAGTVLVVEDEPQVRSLVQGILGRLGYRVLVAATAEEAVALCRERDRPVELLLTDVVLPGLGGPALAVRLRELHPGLRVLYVSGYPDEALGGAGPAALVEAPLLPKPFTPAELVARVREVLAAG